MKYLWAFLLPLLRAEDDPKQYPVTKVVNLLKDMQKKLEVEAEEDEEVDEKMKCWCKDTEQSKAESIAGTESQLTSLGALIETSAAEAVRLSSEIGGHEGDLASSQNSLSAAEAQRKKQQETFAEEEKQIEESLTGVDAALDHLQPTSFLATAATGATKDEALRLIDELQRKHSRLLRGSVPHRRTLMLAAGDARLDVDTTPATGEVVGILSSMKDTMATNLNQTRSEELESAETFNGLRKAKLTEIQATEEAILSKKQQKAKADTTEVRAKKDLEDAQASLLVDKQFLEDAKVKCEAHAAEYAERVKVRNEELVGCSKAAAILSDDSARDTFSRTFNAAFLQLGRANRTQAEQAAAVLAKAAAKSHDARLVAVSHMVRTDAFDQVKQEIDSMVRQLKKVQQEEVSSKDSCVQRLHENSLDTTKSSNSKAQMDSKVSGLQDLVSQTNHSIKTLKLEIEELKSEMKTAKTDMELRQNESSEIIKDQKHTQELLSRALEVLGNVYGQSLLQEAGPDAGSSAVMLLLQQIIGDAKVLQAKAETDFEAAVKDYKQFKDDATVAITTKEQSLVDLGVEKSESKADLLEAHAEATELEKELASLGETKAALREECDLLMNKFDLRQEAREQEIDALVTAKSILSGMKVE
ncbi:unnamed protein product [Durusdinium trenchii]|uniref:Uncharacterized protein n=2 Tax=Durusdinium trenchii TaxID=1381693 RepID=A0ABP0IMF4_9DINO